MPFIRWAMVGVMMLFSVYIYQRDTNAAQVVNIGDLKHETENLKRTFEDQKTASDKQAQEIRNNMLTREVFEAYHKSDTERMDRIEHAIDLILEHQK